MPCLRYETKTHAKEEMILQWYWVKEPQSAVFYLNDSVVAGVVDLYFFLFVATLEAENGPRQQFVAWLSEVWYLAGTEPPPFYRFPWQAFLLLGCKYLSFTPR